jgi:signal transduction histidine kinase
MNLAFSQNMLLYGLVGFFCLVSLLLFYVAQKQIKETRRLREQLYSSQSQNGTGDLATRLTHDISNPLSVIRGAVTEILRTSDDEIINQDLAQIFLKVEEISKLVQNARGYLYQNGGLKEEVIDLKALVDDVLLFYSQRLETHGIELHLINLDNVFLEGSHAQLEQLLLDLVSASIEEVELLPHKWIEISAHYRDHHVQISFRNSGNDPSQELRKRVDGWFFTSGHKGEINLEDKKFTTITLDVPLSKTGSSFSDPHPIRPVGPS